MKRPADFKLFMTVAENKISMCKIILKVWSSPDAAKKLVDRDVYLVVEGHLYHFTSDGDKVTVIELEDYFTTQEETDHKIIMYLRMIGGLLTSNPKRNKVIVRSPDSDIFKNLMYYAHYFLQLKLRLDTGTGDSRRLLAVTECAQDKGKEHCKSLLGLYDFTGEDTTSAFKGKGKVQPYKKLLKYPRYEAAFRQLGLNKDLSEETFKELEAFTCVMYGAPRSRSVDQVRTAKLKEMVGKSTRLKKKRIDLSRLPPPRRCLRQHIKRTHMRAYQDRRYVIAK